MTNAPRPLPEMPALLRGVSRSFYLSIRLLPAQLRRPISLAYLLARATDTVADTTDLGPAERGEMLAALAAAIEGDSGASPISARLAGFAQRQHDQPERDLITALHACLSSLEQLDRADRADIRRVLALITRGQALDIERFGGGPSVAASLANVAQLDEYTYLVAGCVGEFWTELCFRHLPHFAKLPREQMRTLGRNYGMGLQLVNILRDAGADLAAGRCYFPADELRAAGIAPADIVARPESFEPVRIRWQAIAADRLAQGMHYAQNVNHRRVRAASALPALLGARTLALLENAGPRRLGQKVKVPRQEVRMIVGRLALTFAARAPLRALFDRLQPGPVPAEWDNPRP